MVKRRRVNFLGIFTVVYLRSSMLSGGFISTQRAWANTGDTHSSTIIALALHRHYIHIYLFAFSLFGPLPSPLLSTLLSSPLLRMSYYPSEGGKFTHNNIITHGQTQT